MVIYISILPNVLDEIIAQHGIQTTEFWKRQLHSIEPHRVAVLKVSGKLLEAEPLEKLCQEVAILAQYGIYPTLVLGGGKQYDALPGFNDAQKVNGLRVTSPDLMAAISQCAIENQNAIVQSIQRSGADAVALPPYTVKARFYDPQISNGKVYGLGRVGEVTSVDTHDIIALIKQNKIPVVSHVGMLDMPYCQSVPLNINATPVANAIASSLQAMKLVIMGNTPIFDGQKKLIRGIYSPAEAEKLIRDGVIKDGMVINLREAYNALSHMPEGSSVQFTGMEYDLDGKLLSPGLVGELLGDGKGTMINKPYLVDSHPLALSVFPQLRALIDGTIKDRKLALTRDYFTQVPADAVVYTANRGWGGVISYDLPDIETPVNYLCKIFTQENYQGLTVAMSLISHIYQLHGAVTWWSHKDNDVGNKTYHRVVNHYGGISSEHSINGDACYIHTIGVVADKRQMIVDKIISMPRTHDVLQ